MVAKKYIGRSVYIKNNEAMAICTLLVDAAIEQIDNYLSEDEINSLYDKLAWFNFEGKETKQE